MSSLKTGQVDAYLARRDSWPPVMLVYGPDAGLVRERADVVIRGSVDDTNDPFALVRLEGDVVTSEPGRLAEEVHTVPLFGGRRVVSIRVSGRNNIVPAIEVLLASPSSDCRVVIEAGDLRRNAPLRTLIERAKNAVALPCYSDDHDALARLVDQELRAARLTIAPDARAALISLIGGDRLASRGEIRKLVLYAHGKDRVIMEDIDAIVGDASARGMDGVVDAAFAGRKDDFETEFAKECAAGTAPGTILSASLRHVALLHKLRLAVDDGATIKESLSSAVPPIFFRRAPAVETALRLWSTARLVRVMQQLGETVLDLRSRRALPDTLALAIAQRALLSITANARRKE